MNHVYPHVEVNTLQSRESVSSFDFMIPYIRTIILSGEVIMLIYYKRYKNNSKLVFENKELLDREVLLSVLNTKMYIILFSIKDS